MKRREFLKNTVLAGAGVSLVNSAREHSATASSRAPRVAPLAITMWDFSWLERRWPGAGYEDWNNSLDELTERGYDAIRIDAFPHLLATDATKEWTLRPVWSVQDWGSPAPNKIRVLPGLHEFLSKCQDRKIKVELSTWYREDADKVRLKIRSPEEMAEQWLVALESVERAGLLDTIVCIDLCNEWPGDLWCPFFRNDPPELTWGGWYTDKSLNWMRQAVQLVAREYSDIPVSISFETQKDFSRLQSKDLSFAGFADLHLWMAQANGGEFARKVGYKYDRFSNDSYHSLVEKGAATYRAASEYWQKLLVDHIRAAAAAWAPHGIPLISTECWALVDYKDWPMLEWDWIKELCKLGVETAAETGQWVAMASSNFCGPQFTGMWRDIRWHQELTGLIKRSPIRPELRTSKIAKRILAS